MYGHVCVLGENKSCFFVVPRAVLNIYTSKALPFVPEQEEKIRSLEWTTMISTRSNDFYPATNISYSVGFVESFMCVDYQKTRNGLVSNEQEYFAQVRIFGKIGICTVSNQIQIDPSSKEFNKDVRYMLAKHVSNTAYLVPIQDDKFNVCFGHDLRC